MRYLVLENGIVRAVITTEHELIETEQQIRIPDDVELPDDVTSGNYIYDRETKQLIKTS